MKIQLIIAYFEGIISKTKNKVNMKYEILYYYKFVNLMPVLL